MLRLELAIGLRYALVGRGDRYVSLTSAISALGIALGVAAVIVVQAVMNGFHLQLRDRILAASSHLELQRTADNDLANWTAMVEAIALLPGVEGVAPVIDRQGLATSGQRAAGIVVKGIDPQREGSVTEIPEASLAQLTSGGFRVVLGDALAEQLGVAAGDRIVVLSPTGTPTIAGALPRLRRVEVAAVVDFGIYQYDSVLAFMHLDDARAVFRAGPADGIRIRLEDPFLAPELAGELAAEYRVRAYDWTSSNATLFNALAVERRVMFIILSLIILVAAFQIVSALTAMVRSKRGDIAILRTLGAEPAAVLRIFLIQGLLVGVAGTLVGVLLGILGALNVTVIVSFVEDLFGTDLFPGRVYYLEQIPSQLIAAEVAAVAAVGLALTLAATIWPSVAAARVDPAEALRHE